jgi:hypothetical protein
LRPRIKENLKDSFAHLEKEQCRVQTLRLCGWRFLEGEMESLCQALQSPRQAFIAEQGVQQSAQRNIPRVTTLDLSRVNLGKEDIKGLAEMLKLNRSLTTLILRNCQLDDGGVKELASALNSSHSKTSLIRLDLSNNAQVTVESAQVLLDLVRSNTPLLELELDRNTEIAFWNRQIQKALEVTGSHLADKKIQAERNFFFAIHEEIKNDQETSPLQGFVNGTVPSADESVQLLTETKDLLEVTPDEAILEAKLTQQRTLNEQKRDEISQEIEQLNSQDRTPQLEETLTRLEQQIQDLKEHHQELAKLCEAKKQRYSAQQELKQLGKENLWTYYCTLAQRMEEIFVASKAESSLLMGKTTTAGIFKSLALSFALVGKAVNMIFGYSGYVMIPMAAGETVGEWLNVTSDDNLSRISQNILGETVL